MKKIKVLLGDLRHQTIGVHSTYVPVAIGYIATYFQEVLSSQDFEVKLFTNPDEALDSIDEWKPDILGFSSYLWNSNLSHRVCEYAKEKKEDTLCIMGGPEFPSGTGMTNFSESIKQKCLDYLKEKPSIDYYCYSDGEVAFTSIVEEYINSNFSVISMRKNNIVAKGAMNLSFDNQDLLVGSPILRLGLSNKIDGRDCIPSPYLNGYLDKFLNGKFIPSFETARGCPFTCTFCDMGIDPTKIVSFSTKRMIEELDYVCEKVTKFSGTKSIAFHDSNWGMYAKDVALSDHILKLINEKDWPTYIEISTPKNKRQQILDIDTKLKNRVAVGFPQQSMNDETLKLIKRENLTNDEYIKFVRKIEDRNKVVGCELIIPLPNETIESYFKSTKVLMDFGVNVSTYTLMMLPGAELGRDDFIEKYKMQSKWRVVPRNFGIYRQKKIFDVERVCVGTNTMPYKDYLACRRFSFLVHFYSYSLFSPIKLLAKELNISFFELVSTVFDSLEKNINDNSNIINAESFSKLYIEFSKECENELFETKEDIYKFFAEEKNYKKLLNSELGDNLLRKYAAKSICEAFNEVIDYTIDLIMKKSLKKDNKHDEIKGVLESTKLWLKDLYIFDEIFNLENERKKKNIISLEYDVPNWFKKKNESIFNFKKKRNYKMINSKKNENLKNELISLYGSDDKTFVVGKYFHQMGLNPEDITKTAVLVE